MSIESSARRLQKRLWPQEMAALDNAMGGLEAWIERQQRCAGAAKKRAHVGICSLSKEELSLGPFERAQ
jgi:hypothetical protein